MAYNNITLEIYFRPSVVEVIEAGDTVILWVSKSARVCAPVKVDFTLVHYLHGLLKEDWFVAYNNTRNRCLRCIQPASELDAQIRHTN